jgi:hypothetical protein
MYMRPMAGNNIQRSENFMMFGGLQPAVGQQAGPHSPQRRMFKRGGPQAIQHHLNAMHQNLSPQQAQQMMQVNGLNACAAPSQARFFSYNEFCPVQAKSPSNGDESKSEEKKPKKKKNKG